MRIRDKIFFFVLLAVIVFSNRNLPAAGLTEGLAAWYNFDQDSGLTVKDLSSSGNDARLVGSGTSWTRGKCGSAVQFNGQASYLDCGNNQSLRLTDNVTLSLWVKTPPPQPQPYATMASWVKYDGKDTFGWVLYFGMPARLGHSPHFFVGGAPAIGGNDEVSLDDGEWHNLCFTLDRNQTLTYYRDGVKYETKKISKPIVSHDGKLVLGGYLDAGEKYFFKGAFDDVRLYNRVLSAAEVRDLYEATMAGLSRPEEFILRRKIDSFSASADYSILQRGNNKVIVQTGIPPECLPGIGGLSLALEKEDRVICRKKLPVFSQPRQTVDFTIPAKTEPGLYQLVAEIKLPDGRTVKETRQNISVCSRLVPDKNMASVKKGDIVILDDFDLFAPKISPMPQENNWYCRKYTAAGSPNIKQYLTGDAGTPIIRRGLALKGWYAIYLGLVNPGKGIAVSLEKDADRFTTIAPAGRVTENENAVEERFYRYANLSGQETLALKSPSIISAGRLAYIKFVCLTDQQVDLANGKTDISLGKKYIRYNDGDGIYWGGERYDDSCLRESVTRLNKELDIFDTLSWGIGTGALTYNSKVGTLLGGNAVIGPSPKGHELMPVNFRRLLSKGYDPLAIVIDEAHKNKIRLAANLRMDAYYENPPTYAEWFNSKFFTEHPEYRLIGWANRGPETSLDYFYPAVRNERFRILQEAASQYDVDIIDLDYTRYAPFFGLAAADSFQKKYGRQPDRNNDDWEWYKYRAGFMTEFIRDLRRMLDEQGKKKGKRIELWALVHYEHFLRQGLDVETWIKEGLVDAISAGVERQTNTRPDISVEKFVRMAKGTNCKIFARLDLNQGYDPEPLQDPKAWSGFTTTPVDIQKTIYLKYFRQGADGIYLFNDLSAKPKPEAFLNLERWSEFEDQAKMPITLINFSD